MKSTYLLLGLTHKNVTSGKQSGFTLLELMVTVAIIGILATLAVPAVGYRHAQAKWAVNVSEVQPLLDMVGDCYDTTADLSQCDTITKASSGAYTSIATPQHATTPTMVYDSGTITVTVTDDWKGDTMIYTTEVDSYLFRWNRSGTCFDTNQCK